MCAGEDCGRFRVYEISNIAPVDCWTGLDPAVPANAGDIAPFGPNPLGSTRNATVADTKFRQGLQSKWGTPRHLGDDCRAGCRCIRTNEKVGAESVEETRTWRQPITIGAAKFVIRGTYRLKFQDYKGTCDDSDEEGEPISWGDGAELI